MAAFVEVIKLQAIGFVDVVEATEKRRRVKQQAHKPASLFEIPEDYYYCNMTFV